MNGLQRRYTASPAASEAPPKMLPSGGTPIVGYASVFFRAGDPGTEYQLMPGVRERISPEEFNRALRERHDVRALFNHDSNQVLGRTASGTLRLFVDSVGLRYEITPDTKSPIHQAVLSMLRRGDVSGSSFQFIPLAETVTKDSLGFVRTVTDLKLYDVGPVTFPAYKSATSAPRAARQPVAPALDPRYLAIKQQVEREHQAELVSERLRELAAEREETYQRHKAQLEREQEAEIRRQQAEREREQRERRERERQQRLKEEQAVVAYHRWQQSQLTWCPQ